MRKSTLTSPISQQHQPGTEHGITCPLPGHDSVFCLTTARAAGPVLRATEQRTARFGTKERWRDMILGASSGTARFAGAAVLTRPEFNRVLATIDRSGVTRGCLVIRLQTAC
ncbi:hypothetical protein [Tropicimonas sp. S265A]|uniref:hypothetical protein n=1 Tax=Tropicimonas sp. S265A TaxID=3415134 RepID=UPI003C7D9C01